MKQILLLSLLLLTCMFKTYGQEILSPDTKLFINKEGTNYTYIRLRNELDGFEQIDSLKYKMVGFSDSCGTENNYDVYINGVRSFDSMPCFRDYLVNQSKNNGFKLFMWGDIKLVEENNGVDTIKVNNWETDKINYYSINSKGWRIPDPETSTGCKCAFPATPSINDSIVFNFEGTGIRVISEKVYTHGIMNVYLDGKLVKENVDLYAEKNYSVNPYVLYETNNLNDSQHKIKIVTVGQNTKSSSKYIVLHRFEVLKTNEIDIIDIPQSIPDTVYVEKIVEIEKIVHDTVEVIQYVKDSFYLENEVLIREGTVIPDDFEIDGYILKRKEDN